MLVTDLNDTKLILIRVLSGLSWAKPMTGGVDHTRITSTDTLMHSEQRRVHAKLLYSLKGLVRYHWY